MIYKAWIIPGMYPRIQFRSLGIWGALTVDEEISTASSLEEYTNGWENNGKNDLADIAVEKCQSAIVEESMAPDDAEERP
ncbi:hypothetical protein DSL72_002695 [Monilinia vaccinii-corymbosi]|uniref:Uncharacterized protein n=1 Tax=Monilinia vaccinii-corymbosi TaxID=61207 RepID=A0A8A3PDE4_9HELO|nr:hypothetical protein DSL72_002695 [Monilinia vaccinii-corymbosi]